jgi:hypothetical protein
MRVPVEFNDRNLFIAADVWNDLIVGKSTVALSTVSSTAIAILQRDGAFIIDGKDKGILRRFDRLSEFQTHLSEINEQRKLLGIEPFSPDPL